MVDTANTYWSHNGKHQALIAGLQALIPLEGEVPKQHKNRALETFRKAQNCYYDLYNNGLGNRARSFSRVFGITISDYRWGEKYRYDQRMYRLTEQRMDEIILAAAKEQGVEAQVATA